MFNLTKKVLRLLDNSRKKKTIIIIALMIIGGIVESFSVALILPLVSSISNPNNWNSTWYSKIICNIFNVSNQQVYTKTLIILLIFIFIFKSVFLITEKYIQNSFISNSKTRTQKKLLVSYLNLPYEYYLSANSGEILRIINSDTSSSYAVLLNIFTIYTDLITTLMIVIALIYASPFMSVMLLLLILFEVLLLSKIITPIMKTIGRNDRKYQSRANNWILILINGIKGIKVSNNGEYFIDKYTDNANKTNRLEIKNKTLSSLPKLVTETITIVGVLIIIYIQILNGIELNDLIPILSMFAMAAIKLLPIISSTSQQYNSSKYAEGAIDNVLNVIDTFKVSNVTSPNQKNKNVNIIFNKEIDFENITFAYTNSEKAILEDASFKIKMGESVGIIGKSGAGKTTSVDIILGLLKPSLGHVYVDGIDIEDNIGSWLNNLSYIPQQIFLIDDTIRNNVAFGIEEDKISDEQVWRALKDAQLDEFVKELPEQLDTKIGERGTRLSGGQGQRIGIARALYKNPRLLIFDEATSALDNETENAVMESINKLMGKVTMIVIAHRLTTIEHCDTVYRVENKKIIRQK